MREIWGPPGPTLGMVSCGSVGATPTRSIGAPYGCGVCRRTRENPERRGPCGGDLGRLRAGEGPRIGDSTVGTLRSHVVLDPTH